MKPGDMLYTRDVYGNTLCELGQSDPNVVVCDADLSSSTRTALFGRAFPERFFNFGIAEQNMMATAAGLASCGKVVFVSTFAMFATARVLDQIRNSICYNNCNVKIVATHAGLTVGEDGSSHQALEDISFLRSLPNMKVIVPSDPSETAEAILCAHKTQGPFYIRLGRAKTEVLVRPAPFALGKSMILAEGSEVCIVACGIMVKQALLARELLLQKKMHPYVVAMPSIKPFDQEAILKIARKVKGFVTCEEHSILGGLGSTLCEVLAEFCPRPVLRIGTKDIFGQSGAPELLLKEYGLTPEHIAASAERIFLASDGQ